MHTWRDSQGAGSRVFAIPTALSITIIRAADFVSNKVVAIALLSFLCSPLFSPSARIPLGHLCLSTTSRGSHHTSQSYRRQCRPATSSVSRRPTRFFTGKRLSQHSRLGRSISFTYPSARSFRATSRRPSSASSPSLSVSLPQRRA